MSASMTLGQVPIPAGTHTPTYAYLNLGPNPAGVGQTVTVNMFLLIPMLTSESALGFTVEMTDPAGHTTTLGPFNSDATGGTYTTIVPDQIGEYTFQLFYPGQNMTGQTIPGSSIQRQYIGVIADPSQSEVKTLVVQEEPISRSIYPITPLPTDWWQTPVTAENVQLWYNLNGPWLGYSSVAFATTGGYNSNGNYNPYTGSVLSGHVLWSKIWAGGGLTGLSGDEESGHYWSTSQYWPKYAPVIIDGKMISTWYSETTSYSNGIKCTDLYTGQTLWTINTTNPLRCGMVTQWHTINAYGAIGPYIWTTGTLPADDTGGKLVANRGTQFNMYSALTGKYVLSVVNGTNPTFTTDENGNMIGYYINNTVGTMYAYDPVPLNGAHVPREAITITAGNPVLCCFNMSNAIAYIEGSRSNQWGWAPPLNSVIDFSHGVMWAEPLYNNISGVSISPGLAINGVTDDAVVMTGGFTFNQGYGGTTNGWLVVGAQDATTGAQLWCKNLTYSDTAVLEPFTRTQMIIDDGLFQLSSMYNWQVIALNARTGSTAWTTTLETDSGAEPNIYDTIGGISARNGPGVTVYYGFGGDIWGIDNTDGKQLYYTNTTNLMGDPGIETPYNTWPLWTFSCTAQTNDVIYLAVGHEYNPPLFHGSQMLALNITDGSLIWKELGTYVESTAIAYNILLSRNCYDNMIYAFGKGPSATTLSAPSVGVTTATPITITGTIMDVSPGTHYLADPELTMTKQNEVPLRFPNGVPCVSDESQSAWMEYVYQQQPYPFNTTGVPITLSVVDDNGNFRQIGETTSDASGTWAFNWTPDIAGKFQVIANFAGSNSYYPSSATAYFYASDAATPAPSATTAQPVDNTMTIIASTIAILIAIAIVGLLMLRKR
ncbi:MAG: PQQ-binding-like beta-propeller repeat protein [Candidatus Bathyarchaeia archaeon]